MVNGSVKMWKEVTVAYFKIFSLCLPARMIVNDS